MEGTSNSPMHARRQLRVASQSSSDFSHCADLTDKLEQESPHPVGGGSFSDIYKYKSRTVYRPVYFAVKQFRYFSAYKLNDSQTERVGYLYILNGLVKTDHIRGFKKRFYLGQNLNIQIYCGWRVSYIAITVLIPV